MSNSCLGPWDVIDLVGLLSFCLVDPISLWFCPWDVRDVHLISDELRWCDRSHLNLWKWVDWVQWV